MRSSAVDDPHDKRGKKSKKDKKNAGKSRKKQNAKEPARRDQEVTSTTDKPTARKEQIARGNADAGRGPEVAHGHAVDDYADEIARFSQRHERWSDLKAPDDD